MRCLYSSLVHTLWSSAVQNGSQPMWKITQWGSLQMIDMTLATLCDIQSQPEQCVWKPGQLPITWGIQIKKQMWLSYGSRSLVCLVCPPAQTTSMQKRSVCWMNVKLFIIRTLEWSRLPYGQPRRRATIRFGMFTVDKNFVQSRNGELRSLHV